MVQAGTYAGDLDAPDQQLCKRFIDKFGSVNLLDIGANYGHEGMRYALLAKAIGHPLKKHVSIEPALAGLLLPANMVLHGLGQAIMVSAALAAEDSIQLFNFNSQITTGGTLTYNPKNIKANRIPVRLARLDTLANELSLEGPTFLKVDIQGVEKYLLEGGENYFTNNVCAGICEFMPGDFGGIANAASFLQRFSHDYAIFDVGIYRNKLVRLGADFELFSSTLAKQDKSWTDFIFYPKSLGDAFMS